MNKYIIFALALTLVACVPKFQDTKAVFAEIDKDHFGNAFISAIALNMATETPVEEITLLIDQIISEIDTEQGSADEKNRTDQAVCDETINGLIKQIEETKTTIESLKGAINDNEEILTQAKISLEQAIKDYDETVEAIQIGTAEREKEHSRWAEEDYQNSISIATLEEGVKLIQHMIHGVAFAQIKTRYDAMMGKLKTQDKHSMLFKPLITSLTQLATKLNYENVMKILELLNNIRAGILEEQEIARQAEQQAQADWEALLAQLENQKQSLADKISRLRSLIEGTTALLAQLKESLENHTLELDNAQQSLAAQQAWCSEQSNAYMTESSERAREKVILQKLIDHLNEKFSQVAEYVSGR